MKIKNRKEVEDWIYRTFDALDPTKFNSMKYRRVFGEMDDKQFGAFMDDFMGDDQQQFILDIVELEHRLTFDKCEACAKLLNIPLMETVYMPHLTGDRENVISSVKKCLVGYCPIKRTQQMLHKKNGLSIDNNKVSQLTGQVTAEDKNARDSDVEAAMLIALGADRILAELHGPRADDEVMKRQMRSSITDKGYVLLDELEDSPVNKVTLNTVNTFLLCMGIKSDLVTDTYILPRTSKEHFR